MFMPPKSSNAGQCGDWMCTVLALMSISIDIDELRAY